MSTARRVLVISFLLLLTSGCSLIAGKTTLVTSPNTQYQIIRTNWWGDKAWTAVYDPSTNAMVEYGWVDIEKLNGWTLGLFDWNKYIEGRE